jgi:hypothetical protein
MCTIKKNDICFYLVLIYCFGLQMFINSNNQLVLQV